MRNRLYAYTKPRIVSVRFNDDEMEYIQSLMEVTGMTPSDVLRKAFIMLKEQLEQAGERDYSPVGHGCAADNAESACPA